jgi:1,4-dihydroxy-2-naphthoyl-CoA hydrolase
MPTETVDADVASELNAVRDGWNLAMGVRFVRATADEVIVEWDVAPQHLQPYGIVHGGVHAGVIETIASIGAAIHARSRGQAVVGLENHTSFLRAVREGLLRATARPLTRGRTTQVWEGTVTDTSGRTVATGRVRLLCLEPEATLAGTKVERKPRVG